MPCLHPLDGFRSQNRNPSGKRSIVFTKQEGYSDLRVKLPCGRCHECRLSHSRQWAARVMNEASLYDDNCFITLTYDDDHLPKLRDKIPTLQKEDIQKFFKSLKKLAVGEKIRQLYCGEYGEKNGRPHYHACLMNCDFRDKVRIEDSRSGEKQYESATLSKLWKRGRAVLGTLTFASAAYVARYVTKKVFGPDSEKHYEAVDTETGESLGQVVREFAYPSRRPGIGHDWFLKYKNSIYPCDYMIVDGKKVKPPKYYDKLLERYDPELHKKVQAKRWAYGEEVQEEWTGERLRTREFILDDKLFRLKRGL